MIGIMQGRLTPRYNKKYQAHPVDYWQAEFFIAKELGFSTIEFVLDYHLWDINPLMSARGISEVNSLINKTEVKVKSVCADYFMERPLFGPHGEESLTILRQIINNAPLVGYKDVVIPCVDQSSIKSEKDEDRFVLSLKSVLMFAEEKGVLINLELDYSPDRFVKLLKKLDHPSIKVNYDIGNSASLGFNPKEELEAYGEFISDLHIKDRKKGGGSVELGTGNADFKTVFDMLKKKKFNGNIVMQSARAESYIDEILFVKKQKDFILPFVESLYASS